MSAAKLRDYLQLHCHAWPLLNMYAAVFALATASNTLAPA
jgi:hypothetical protein